jgi:hypothetical protein
VLNLEEGLSGFYEVAAAEPDLDWGAADAGRMLRSPTVFEEVVNTICSPITTEALTEDAVVDVRTGPVISACSSFHPPPSLRPACRNSAVDLVVEAEGGWKREIRRTVNVPPASMPRIAT